MMSDSRCLSFSTGSGSSAEKIAKQLVLELDSARSSIPKISGAF